MTFDSDETKIKEDDFLSENSENKELSDENKNSEELTNMEPVTKAIIDFRNGLINEDRLALISLPEIRRISRAAARKIGVNDDDLTQEMWSTFLKVVVVKFDVTQKIEPYIRGCANRVAKSLLNPNSLVEVNLDDDGHAAVEASNSINSEDYHVDFEGDVDRKSAIDKIASHLYDGNGSFTSKGNIMGLSGDDDDYGFEHANQTTMNVENPVVVEKKLPPQKSKEKRKRKLSASQQYVVDSRKTLEKRQEEFAKEIGVTIYSLSSYEYGRANPPERVINKIKLLMSGDDPRLSQVKKLKKAYEQPMSQILSKWCVECKLDYTNDHQLALAMDTTIATIHRWKSDSVKPSIDDIEKYRLTCIAGAKKMHFAAQNYIVIKETGVLGRA